MENKKIKIDILPNKFLSENGTFDKEKALDLSGKIAGICYSEYDFSHLQKEEHEQTLKRIDRTLNSGHHSVYDHIYISFSLNNIPKILAMYLNNEKQYTTSEKSLRYTKIEDGITSDELELYNKWVELFSKKIKDVYGKTFKNFKVRHLAQENARYLTTVFIPTNLIYTTSLRQINYLASWMVEYIKNADTNNDFENKLALSMQEFLNELERINVLEYGLMKNEKHRSFSLISNDLSNKREYFGDIYQMLYKGSFASLAQAHRHRTLNYQLQLLDNKEYFVPKIIENDLSLKEEWCNDIKSVGKFYPQGELVLICENGTFENYIEKCKERLCSGAQFETMLLTKENLLRYKEYLEKESHPLAEEIKKYTNGARCTFPNYECLSKCGFKEGISLVRKI